MTWLENKKFEIDNDVGENFDIKIVVNSIFNSIRTLISVITVSSAICLTAPTLKAFNKISSGLAIDKKSLESEKIKFKKWLNENRTENVYNERLLRRRILWGLVSIVETISVPRNAVSSSEFVESLSEFQVWAIKRLLNELFGEHLDLVKGVDKKMIIALEGAVGWGIQIPSNNENYAYDRNYFIMSINRFLYKVKFFLEHKSISCKDDEKAENSVFSNYEVQLLESLDIPFVVAQAYARRFDILGISDMYYVGVLPEIANDYPFFLDGTSVAFLYFDGISSYVAHQHYFRFNNYDISILKNHGILISDAMLFDSRFDVVDIIYFLENGVSFKVANFCDISLNAFEIVDIYGE